MKTDAPAALTRRADFIVRVTVQKALEGDFPFHPCQGQPHADMRTTGKGQMPIGFAPDTEFRRFLKDFASNRAF